MEFLEWLKQTAFSEWMAGTTYGHPILLCFHAMGMAVVVGIIWMVAFRTLGYARGVPILSLEQAFRLAWLGFALNAISGIWLFTLNGDNYLINRPFQLKMAFIAGGGVAIWALWRTLTDEARRGVGAPSSKAKIIAVIAALAWLAAIVAGRLIAYTLQMDLPYG